MFVYVVQVGTLDTVQRSGMLCGVQGHGKYIYRVQCPFGV